MKINGNSLGISLGITWGATVFLATVILLVKAKYGIHYEPTLGIGPTLGKLGQFYMGYSVTYFGAIVGFIYGFVHAYIVGRIVAWIYNLFTKE